jgi:DNA transposition AAA+ family ATPase
MQLHYVKPNDWNIVRTSNFEATFKICNDAKRHGKMIGIIGYTGAGKTTALSEYYRAKKDVYLVTCKKSMKPRQFFEKLLKQIGVTYTGTIYDMIEKASELLNSKPNPLLIIDEAGKLSPTLMLYIHDLRDNTMGHAGIVMAGVDYFKANLLKAVLKQKEGMPEFFSRVIMWYELRVINKGEIEAICSKNGLTDAATISELLKGENRVKDYRELFNAITNYKQIELSNDEN